MGHQRGNESVNPSLPRLDEVEVDALTVRSWSGCDGDSQLPWDELNANWQQLGDREIHIDYSYQPACAGPVTYEDLVARDADVLILSDTGGDHNQLSAAEIDAIQRYVADGHGLIATFLLSSARRTTVRSHPRSGSTPA